MIAWCCFTQGLDPSLVFPPVSVFARRRICHHAYLLQGSHAMPLTHWVSHWDEPQPEEEWLGSVWPTGMLLPWTKEWRKAALRSGRWSASDLGIMMGSTGPRTSGLLHVTKSKAWTLPKAWLKSISHWTSMIPPCLRLFGSMVCPDKSTLEVNTGICKSDCWSHSVIPSDLVRAGEKRSRCALRSYCGHNLRVEIPYCHDFTCAPNKFSDGLRHARYLIRFPLRWVVRSGDYHSAQFHGFRADVCFPSCFRDRRDRLLCKPCRQWRYFAISATTNRSSKRCETCGQHIRLRKSPCRHPCSGVLRKHQSVVVGITRAFCNGLCTSRRFRVDVDDEETGITMKVRVFTSVSVKVGGERSWLFARSAIFQVCHFRGVQILTTNVAEKKPLGASMPLFLPSI